MDNCGCQRDYSSYSLLCRRPLNAQVSSTTGGVQAARKSPGSTISVNDRLERDVTETEDETKDG